MKRCIDTMTRRLHKKASRKAHYCNQKQYRQHKYQQKKIIQKKWEEKQLHEHFKRQLSKTSYEKTWIW